MADKPEVNYARFTFAEVKAATGANGPDDGEVVGVTTDSRQVKANNLFVALKGERFDGHDFLEQAKRLGALTLGAQGADFNVADPLLALGDLARFHRRRFNFPVVAVTGSYGKTSTRALIEAAFHEDLRPNGFAVLCATKGNFNNEIGLPLTVLNFSRHGDAAVIEMGMRGRGQIEYLAKVAEPTIGIITNIGPQHIELLGSIEEIALAKAELLEALPEGGLAVLPFDSPFFELLRAKCKCRVVTFGTQEGADYRVSQVQVSPDGRVEFSVGFGIGEKSQPVVLRLPGVHNAVNASAAFALAHQLGVEPSEIALALESAELPGARMRVVKTSSGATLIDDCYNAGPDSMRAALQTLLDFPGSGRRVAVLGDMKELGEFSEAEHREIGAFAGQFVELLVGVGGETRPLLNAAIQAAREVENEMEVHWFETASEAKEAVGQMIQEGDVVLVKGSRSVGLEAVVEGFS